MAAADKDIYEMLDELEARVAKLEKAKPKPKAASKK